MANLTASNLTSISKEMNSTQDKTQHGFRAVFLIVNITMNSITCPFTIALNVLVILAIKRRRSLQSNANIMLACLAVTDVLIGLEVQPALIIWNISLLVGTKENFPEFGKFQEFFVPWLVLSACLHLMAVVWERLVAIKFPYRYPHVLTKRNIKLAILFCWIYSGSCRIVMYVIGRKSIIYGIFATHIPITCVIFVSSSYVVLYSETRRHQRMIKTQRISQEHAEKFLKDSKALKTTVLVVAAVGLCFLPMSLYIILINYHNKCKLPDNLDATSVNTVTHSRRSIPSMFVKSIKKLPFDFGVVYNTKLVKY